jgi:hypothetical protein
MTKINEFNDFETQRKEIEVEDFNQTKIKAQLAKDKDAGHHF